jgi:F-type H+-transporting ATPase subunit alpha
LRLDLAQYREMASFSMFASDLDKSTQALLERGRRTTEILKQDQYAPLPVEKQIVIIFAANNGFLDGLEVADLRRYERELYTYLDTHKPDLLAEILEKKDIKGELTDRMKAALTEFGGTFLPTAPTDEAAANTEQP